ncbi:hypothetical protein ACS0TY_013911 [Phlomoides rotata]
MKASFFLLSLLCLAAYAECYECRAEDSSSKTLVLWLNGGPGCSSIGSVAFTKYYGTTNMPGTMSPAGMGFSYSNKTSDYVTGDKQTAADDYTFLVNWLERLPEYKTGDLYITGESYAGHYVPQLADLVLQNNKITNQTVINLKGIAVR